MWGWIDKSPFDITRLAKWWQMVVAKGCIFLSQPHINSGFFWCLPLNTTFSYSKKAEYAARLSATHHDDVTRHPPCCCSIYILPTGWYVVCEIEVSHIGKNSRNPNLVCKKKILYHRWLLNCRQSFYSLIRLSKVTSPILLHTFFVIRLPNFNP